MSVSTYVLRINADEVNFEKISKTLSVVSTSQNAFWEYSIEESSPFYLVAISHLTELVSQKKDKLKEMGILTSDITVWYFYEFSDQCNFEFSSKDMKLLGELGLDLCISCYPSNG